MNYANGCSTRHASLHFGPRNWKWNGAKHVHTKAGHYYNIIYTNRPTNLSKHLEPTLYMARHIRRCYRWIEAPSLLKPLRTLEFGRLKLCRRTTLTSLR